MSKQIFRLVALLAILLLPVQLAQGGGVHGTVKSVCDSVFWTYSTGTGTLELNASSASSAMQVLEVRVHLGAATTTETLKVSIDSTLGAYYDAALSTQTMTGVGDYVFRPSSECILDKNDLLKVWCPNAAGTRWGAVIIWRKRD